jgi:hypothetical protein
MIHDADWRRILFLLNKTREGKLKLSDNLIFHGRVGHTRETRLFYEPDLNRQLQLAGLEPRWATEPYIKHAITFPKPWSIP